VERQRAEVLEKLKQEIEAERARLAKWLRQPDPSGAD